MKIRLVAAVTVMALGLAGFHLLAQKRPAPDVAFVTLQGETIRSAELRGKVVLVNFWATTCASCIRKMPMLVSTHEKFAGRSFETIAVAMDYDLPSQVKAYAERTGLPFKVALDVGGGVAHGFDGVRLTPTTFLMDKRGHIVHKYLGEPDFDKLHVLLDKLLAEPV